MGDSASKSSDTNDWALFMPKNGNGRGDYSGARTWAFGSEYRTNAGYNGMVYIYGNAVTKNSYYTLFNGIGGLATHKNTWTQQHRLVQRQSDRELAERLRRQGQQLQLAEH